MNWSEASRYYYASLFFAQQIYGTVGAAHRAAPQSLLDAGRALLNPQIRPIWLHRAWQVFLWLVMPALTALLIPRRPFRRSTL